MSDEPEILPPCKQALAAEDMPKWLAAMISKAEMDPKFAYLDAESTDTTSGTPEE